MGKSAIEWTGSSWNAIGGCSIVSPGCTNCYAMQQAQRIQNMGTTHGYDGTTRKSGNRIVWTGKVNLIEKQLNIPNERKKPETYFVNSMSDFFHESIPLDYQKRMFKVMNENLQHTFQILTKRPERMLQIAQEFDWSENIWIGVSVESEDYSIRLLHLSELASEIQRKLINFVSFEPLLGEISQKTLERYIRHKYIAELDWVVVGGESGKGCRPVNPDWVRKIRDVCLEMEIPFFFKQWGGYPKKKYGNELDGKVWQQMPKKRYIPELDPKWFEWKASVEEGDSQEYNGEIPF